MIVVDTGEVPSTGLCGGEFVGILLATTQTVILEDQYFFVTYLNEHPVTTEQRGRNKADSLDF
jgi:hypothetical protein